MPRSAAAPGPRPLLSRPLTASTVPVGESLRPVRGLQKARDACIVEKGEAHCGDLVEAHKVCMRKLGFEV